MNVLFRRDNELSQASFVSSFDDLGKVQLSPKELMFQVTDPDLDPFDNEYIEFRFKHVKYENDIYSSEDIPIVPCENDLVPPFQKTIWYPGQFYCPDYADHHVMYKNWYQTEYSYYEL